MLIIVGLIISAGMVLFILACYDFLVLLLSSGIQGGVNFFYFLISIILLVVGFILKKKFNIKTSVAIYISIAIAFVLLLAIASYIYYAGKLINIY